MMELELRHYEQDWTDYKRHILICEEGVVMIDILHTTQNRFGCKTIIWGLYVYEQHRRKGVAKQLLSMAEGIAQDNGQEIVCLEWEKPTPLWVLDWYCRMGYNEREFGKDYAAMYKTLTNRKED